MELVKRYNPQEVEPRLQTFWQASGVYHFSPHSSAPVFSIDTPPPTVSGLLHLGHVYSYTHTDLIARFRRMRGENVFYPMGFDDNGLPTERLVERELGLPAVQVGRRAFIDACLRISANAEKDYQALWQRLGLSVDWRYTYRTIDENARRVSQRSFIDLYHQGLVYRQRTPTLWCPECRTALAQADLDDLQRDSEYITLPFELPDGSILPIATTRPELLPACVAVFIHPGDERFKHLVGQQASVPLFGGQVPVMQDLAADPGKGSGAVMCCTFGDATDVYWWRAHNLPLVEVIARDGTLSQAAAEFSGLPVIAARQRILRALEARHLVISRQPTLQSVRIHDRCDTPVEYILTRQWFIKVLENKAELLAAGEGLNWFPEHMHTRYRSWVENLAWDWCISRQRYFGVPIPLWYCRACGENVPAGLEQLPVDPLDTRPSMACQCGSTEFDPEKDVLDTWATSSMTPQIIGAWLSDPDLYQNVYPMSLRPQGHEIIRTWAFYTMLKSHYHFSEQPWKDIAISGWGLASEGMGKISKSRGGGPVAPQEIIAKYSADAVRYWAASTGPGKDAAISLEKIQMGAKLVTKVWNVARFSARFIADFQPPASSADELASFLTPADRWILSRTQRVIRSVTAFFENYDYAAAKNEVEIFFWTELADNYLEMCKQRLYDGKDPLGLGARYTLYHLLLAVVKLFAPFLPHVTEEIYQGLFTPTSGAGSLHRSAWPTPDTAFEDDSAEAIGADLVAIATAVRRYKSERNIPLSAELHRLHLSTRDASLASELLEARPDLISITRARLVDVGSDNDPYLIQILANDHLQAAISPQVD